MCHRDAVTIPSRHRTAVVGLLAVVLALVGALVSPAAPASAASHVYLSGYGSGHGIGLSQQGALARARDGHTATQILAAYYPGTTMATASDSTQIRVRIDDTDDDTTVVAEPGLRLRTSAGTVSLPTTVGGTEPTQWRIAVSSGALVVQARLSGRWRDPGMASLARILREQDEAQFADTDGTVTVDHASSLTDYTGVVRAVRTTDGYLLRTVVIVELRDYVASVLGWEMPSRWPAAALRAQAVAIRTLARYTLRQVSGRGYYDAEDTAAPEECYRSCQVFLGRADINRYGSPITTWAKGAVLDAVAATAGRYLRYDGVTARADYGESNGGYAASGGQPYLRPGADPYDEGRWWGKYEDSASFEVRYPSIGRFAGITAARDGRGPYGGRVTALTVYGSRGSVTVPGSDLVDGSARSTLFGFSVEGVSSRTAHDADRDGDLDLVTTSPAGQAFVRFGTGRGSWGSAVQLGGAWTGKDQVAVVGGLTGSGLAEIVTVEGPGHDLVSYPVRPAGGVGTPMVVHTGDWSRYDLFLGVNGLRGWPSGLLARQESTGNLYYFASTREGTLVSRAGTGVNFSDIVTATAAGDWNRDGYPDVIALDDAGSLWLYPGATQLATFAERVLLSDASGWAARTSLVGGGDFDGDGVLDLVSVTDTGALMLNSRTSGNGIGTGVRLDSGWTHQLLS